MLANWRGHWLPDSSHLYCDSVGGLPHQLEFLDLPGLKRPKDGQVKVTIVGEGEYETEKV